MPEWSKNKPSKDLITPYLKKTMLYLTAFKSLVYQTIKHLLLADLIFFASAGNLHMIFFLKLHEPKSFSLTVLVKKFFTFNKLILTSAVSNVARKKGTNNNNDQPIG